MAGGNWLAAHAARPLPPGLRRFRVWHCESWGARCDPGRSRAYETAGRSRARRRQRARSARRRWVLCRADWSVARKAGQASRRSKAITSKQGLWLCQRWSEKRMMVRPDERLAWRPMGHAVERSLRAANHAFAAPRWPRPLARAWDTPRTSPPASVRLLWTLPPAQRWVLPSPLVPSARPLILPQRPKAHGP